MVDGLPASCLVVDANVRVGGDLPAGRHDADAHEFEPLPFELGYGEGEHDDRVDLTPRRETVEEVTPVLDIADVVEQHIQVRVAQHCLQPFEESGEEPPRDVRHYQGDPSGRAPDRREASGDTT